MSAQFDVETFSRHPDRVARLARSQDVFSIMRRRIELPPGCVALMWREAGRPRLVSEGGSIASDGVSELLFVRTAPFELHYDVPGLRSADGYDFSASVDLAVRIVPERTELEMLRKSVLGSAGRIDTLRLHAFCEETVRSALAEFAQSRDAADLAAPTTWDAFDGVLEARFKPVGFDSGLSLGPDPRVAFASPGYAEARRTEATAAQHQRRVEADARVRSAAVDATVARLSKLEDVLEQARDLARRHDGVAVADLIRTFDSAQRGELYHALVATHEDIVQTEAILVAAGEELLRFAPQSPESPACRTTFDTPLGGLRSVRRTGHGTDPAILVGAARGVHLLDADGACRTSYTCDAAENARGGFNAATLSGRHVYATHSEIGLVRWPIDDPARHERCLVDLTDGARSVRDVQIDENGRLWLSVDDRIVGWSPDDEGPPEVIRAPDRLTSTVVCDGSVMAGTADGRVLRWPLFDLAAPETIRGPSRNRVRSIAWVAGGGIPRLLIADGRPQLDLQVLGDAFSGAYRARHAVRWGLAADDRIVGVDATRDKLLIWRIERPEEPAATVSIGRVCGHSIQDAALLPARSARTDTA